MSWNIKTPGDYINGPLTVAGDALFSSKLGVGAAATVAKLQTNGALCVSGPIGNLSTNPQANTFSADILSNQVRLMALGPNNSTAGAFAFVLASANASVYSTPMTLDSVGLGIGVAPAGKLSVSSGGAQLDVSTSATNLTFEAINRSAVSNPIDTRFYTRLGTFQWYGGQYTELLRLNGNGALVLAGGATAANGIGIAFPAAQSASTDANTLDDYEEGTFTPAITGSTIAGTATYVGRNGRYTKVGNQVHVQIFIDWNSHTGTGDIRITGLPFTNGANFSGAVVGYANAITVTAGYFIAAYVDAAQPWILLNQIPTGGGTNQTVPIDSAGTLVVSATYAI